MTNQIKLVNALPGRLRLRMAALRDNPPLAEKILTGITPAQGVKAVDVRLLTGSILCVFDPAKTSESALLEQVRELAGVKKIDLPESRSISPQAAYETGPSGVARAVAELVQSVDRDIMRLTRGQFDLGAATSMAFFIAGALEVAVKQKLPTPPWFNLAWWGVRTFMTTELDAIQMAAKTSRV